MDAVKYGKQSLFQTNRRNKSKRNQNKTVDTKCKDVLRLDSQQNTYQIFLNFLDMICLAINYDLVKNKPK